MQGDKLNEGPAYISIEATSQPFAVHEAEGTQADTSNRILQTPACVSDTLGILI